MNPSLADSSRPPGEGGDGDWLRISEELHRELNRRAGNLAVMVQGRVVYEIMETSWPGRPLFDPTDRPLELELVENAEFERGVTMHRFAVSTGEKHGPH